MLAPQHTGNLLFLLLRQVRRKFNQDTNRDRYRLANQDLILPGHMEWRKQGGEKAVSPTQIAA